MRLLRYADCCYLVERGRLQLFYVHWCPIRSDDPPDVPIPDLIITIGLN